MPFGFLAGGLGLLGGLIGGGSQIAAAQEQAQAEEYAAQLQQQMFEQIQKNEAPFVSGGQNALAALQKGLGIGPGTNNSGVGSLNAPFNPANLAQTPGYQFTLNQGLDAATNAASRTGNIGGGNTLKALTGYASGLADTTYQQQLEDYMAAQQQSLGALGGLTTLGSNAGSNSATGASTFGGQIGSALSAAGATTASGITGAANAFTGGINSALQNYLTYNALNSGIGGGIAGGYDTGTSPINLSGYLSGLG